MTAAHPPDLPRYSLLVQAGVATVAAFAPIGAEAGDWRLHDATDSGDTSDRPWPEILAHHRDRWAHITHYADFGPLLTFHNFDAAELVAIAERAGAQQLIHTARALDGWCWWDAPNSEHTSLDIGPRRAALDQIADACRARGMPLGVSVGLDDWSDRRARTDPSAWFDDVLGAQVRDLQRRFAPTMLTTFGPLRHGVTPEALCALLTEVAGTERQPSLAATDQCAAPHLVPIVAVEPEAIAPSPWILQRPLGRSYTHNRNEGSEHLLSAAGVIDVLTETLAKGGSLILGVGAAIDGQLPDAAQRVLTDAGRWLRANPAVLGPTRPFDVWGDAQRRYLRVDAPADATAPGAQRVLLIDLAAQPALELHELLPQRYEVVDVDAVDGAALSWQQHSNGLSIERIDGANESLATVYSIVVHPHHDAAALFAHADVVPVVTGVDCEALGADDVLQLGDGAHRAPVRIPAGVTVRGIGWERTTLLAETRIELEAGARLEHVRITASHRGDDTVELVGLDGPAATLSGAFVDGVVRIDGDDGVVRGGVAAGIAGSGQRSTVDRCVIRVSTREHRIGIDLAHSGGHALIDNELVGHTVGIRLDNVDATTVNGNRISAQRSAIDLQQCDHVDVIANRIERTMRGVEVVGGNGASIIDNTISDGDSGVVIAFGATDTAVVDNRIERCRIGALVWDAPTTRLGSNELVDLIDHASVHGPDPEPG